MTETHRLHILAQVLSAPLKHWLVCLQTFARKQNFLTAGEKRSQLLWIDLQVQRLVIHRHRRHFVWLSAGYEADLYGSPPHCFTVRHLEEFLGYSGQILELVLGLNLCFGGLWFVGFSKAGLGEAT